MTLVPLDPATRPAASVLLALLALAGSARAQVHEAELFPEGAGALSSKAGPFAALAERGVELSLFVLADASWPLAGGLRRRRTDRALVLAAAGLDLERLLGLGRTTVYAEAYALRGRDASQDVGDVQVFSNIDGDHLEQLSELWIEHASPGGGLRVKVGKLDANTELAYPRTGVVFVHSSAGFSPTIFPLPTSPDPAFAVLLAARPGGGLEVRVAAFDARDGGTVSGRRGLTAELDAAFLIGQVARSWSAAGGGRLVLGFWRHTGRLARFQGGLASGTDGPYAILEQRLAGETRDPGDDRGLTGFLQWGAADEDLTPFEAHLGAGLLCTGLVPGHDDWRTGLYVSHVDLTDAPAAGLGGRELAVELFQELRLAPWATLRPDLQWIDDPAGGAGVDDAWVATLRLELSL